MYDQVLEREYTGKNNSNNNPTGKYTLQNYVKYFRFNSSIKDRTKIYETSQLNQCPPYSCAFEPSMGDLYAISDEAGQVWVRSKSDSCPPTCSKFHNRAIYDFEWLTGDKRNSLITASADCSLCLIDVGRDVAVLTLNGHSQSVKSVSRVQQNNSLVLSSSTDGSVRMWDLRRPRGAVWHVPETPHSRSKVHSCKSVTCVRGTTGSTLVSAGSDGTVKLWDTRKRVPLDIYNSNLGCSCLAVSSDYSTVYGSMVSQKSCITKLLIGRDRRFQLVGTFNNVVINSFFVRIALSPDDNWLLCGASDYNACYFDVAKGGYESLLLGHIGEVTAVDWSPTQTEILTASDDYSVALWRISNIASSEGFASFQNEEVSWNKSIFRSTQSICQPTVSQAVDSNVVRDFIEGIKEMPTRVDCKVVKKSSWWPGNVETSVKGTKVKRIRKKVKKRVKLGRQSLVNSYFHPTSM